jgi:acyl-CoA thioesterase I
MNLGFFRLALGALALAALACPGSGAAPAPVAVVCFGDSITAGYGLADPAVQAYPARLGQLARERGLDWTVVNAGLSGETSAGGLRRVDWVLRQPVDLFLLELGGNDGLRGIAPEVTESNLQAIIDRVRAARPRARLLIAGMRMPASMGEDYTAAFDGIFKRLAERNHATLVPFILDGVAGNAGLMQEDAIHPNAAGAAEIARRLWPRLEDALR